MSRFRKYNNGLLIHPENPLIAIMPDPAMQAEDDLRYEYQQLLLEHGDIGISEEDYIARRQEQIAEQEKAAEKKRPAFAIKLVTRR